MNRKRFLYEISFAGLVDIGMERTSNQDEVILCPAYGFFAVSDGMGGLKDGGKTSAMIKRVMPEILQHAEGDLADESTPERAAEVLRANIAMLSDSIYEAGNTGRSIDYGATLCGVWLIERSAVFINIGDSRGYLVKRDGSCRQITKDHNVAAMLVESGNLTKEQAKHHSTSSRITRFVGMPKPAAPETFIEPLEAGDIMLFCSDGLHGMLEDETIFERLTCNSDPDVVCKRLIAAANSAGGRDNISAVYVRVKKRGLFS